MKKYELTNETKVVRGHTLHRIKAYEYPDAIIIAAAPKLYKALYELLEIVCVDCNSEYKIDGKCVGCPRVVAARAALAEAAGESEVK